MHLHCWEQEDIRCWHNCTLIWYLNFKRVWSNQIWQTLILSDWNLQDQVIFDVKWCDLELKKRQNMICKTFVCIFQWFFFGIGLLASQLCIQSYVSRLIRQCTNFSEAQTCWSTYRYTTTSTSRRIRKCDYHNLKHVLVNYSKKYWKA